eukprot:Em0002g1716a
MGNYIRADVTRSDGSKPPHLQIAPFMWHNHMTLHAKGQASSLSTSSDPPNATSEPVTLGPTFNILKILRSFPKGTSAGSSGLSVQHLLDAASIPLHTSIGDFLKGIVNLMASGKVPVPMATFLAGGRLIALNKGKEGNPPDVMPIAVGETLRRLTGKCICAILRDKISSFFQPSQFGVACKAGAEKIVHSLRRCIEENWLSGDFVLFKVDMSNAFNMVSRQAVMDQCATYFPELLPWVSWCYGSHTSFWHPMGQISSQTGVQQGDPLGPMLFALVLLKLVTSTDADDDCLQLLLEAWYLDDGVLAGERSAVIRALHLIEDLGPHLGLYINFSKCELFSRSGNSLFPPVVKSSLLPNLDILGAPIGDFVHCSCFIAEKCAMPKILLKALVDVSTVDLHVAFSLLRMCGSYCKLIHLARATPPSHCADYLKLFDEEVIMQPPADMVHNHLRDIFANFCRRTHLSVRVEVGYGLARDHVNSRPADVLVQGWDRGKPGAFDVTVASPLTPVTLNNASTSVGAAAYAAELRKHVANDTRCQELGWICIPLAVETYGNWGMEAQSVFSRLASLLAIGQAIPKPKMLGDIYGHLNMSLVRSVARAIMGRDNVRIG